MEWKVLGRLISVKHDCDNVIVVIVVSHCGRVVLSLETLQMYPFDSGNVSAVHFTVIFCLISGICKLFWKVIFISKKNESIW
jgi:hypothetical protein